MGGSKTLYKYCVSDSYKSDYTIGLCDSGLLEVRPDLYFLVINSIILKVLGPQNLSFIINNFNNFNNLSAASNIRHQHLNKRLMQLHHEREPSQIHANYEHVCSKD